QRSPAFSEKPGFLHATDETGLLPLGEGGRRPDEGEPACASIAGLPHPARRPTLLRRCPRHPLPEGEGFVPKLLVSVRSAAEATLALRGGADWIDVKDPTRGSLGAATMATICDVAAVLDQLRIADCGLRID